MLIVTRRKQKYRLRQVDRNALTGDISCVSHDLYLIESNKYKQLIDPKWLKQIPGGTQLRQFSTGSRR